LKVSDIPISVDNASVDLRAKALKCFDWDSTFIYNHFEKIYENPKEIDSFCK
jgi:hypothetical protein